MGEYQFEVAELRDIAGQLRVLRRDFECLNQWAQSSYEAVGHREVVLALEEFSDNWRGRKERLMKKLDELSGFMEVAADSYEGLETELTKAYIVPGLPPLTPAPRKFSR